jgi:protein SCO1/2
MITRRRLFALLALPLAACSPKPAAFRNTDITGMAVDTSFVLDDFSGRPRKLAEFRGKAVVLFFGYTSCPDICPTALAKYAALMREPGIGPEQVQVVFVTLDPERDTPQRLTEYVRWFHPSFIGLTGNPATIADVAKRMRVTAIRRDIPGSMGYVLDHTAGAYVFGPDGQLRLFLAEDASTDAIASDLRRLLAGE